MDESAIADSPTPPQAGPSLSRVAVDQVFEGFDVDGFDWNSYEGTYKGRALITRLLHIPHVLLARPVTTDEKLLRFARTAILRAIPHIKQTWDHNLYMRCIEMINITLGRSLPKPSIAGEEGNDGASDDEDEPMADSIGDLGGEEGQEADGKLDIAWIQSVRDEEKKEITRTDVELRGYMSNLIKESIRLTHLSFARMAIKSGKYGDVVRHLGAAREFSSSPLHHIEQGLSSIEASLVFNHMAQLVGVVSKVEAAVDRVYPATTGPARTNVQGTTGAGAITADDIREHRERNAKAADTRRDLLRTLRIAKGLSALHQAKFERAGEEFTDLIEDGGLGPKEGEAISTSDAALIAGICTLATGSRDRIRDVLLGRSSFRSAVDDTQQWLLEVVRLFADAQYGEMRTLLEQAKPTLVLNPFLSPHVSALLQAINTRAVVQYIRPFSTVSLTSMSAATGMAEDALLLEVEQLIESGKIKGKIDLIAKILSIRDAEPRHDAYKSAMQVGSGINASTRAAIIRMRLQEAKIEVNAKGAEDNSISLGPTDSAELENGAATTLMDVSSRA